VAPLMDAGRAGGSQHTVLTVMLAVVGKGPCRRLCSYLCG
jgi:hypothetical protein